MLRTKACAVAMASGVVSLAAMISTSCIIGCSAGLKKCRLSMLRRSPPPAAKSAPSRRGPIELEFEATRPSCFMPAPSAR
jgi:hypothetical protein